MKPVALLLGTLMILGVAGVALAQSDQPAQSPSGQSSQVSPPKADVDVKPNVQTESKPSDQPAVRDRGPNVNSDINRRDSSSGNGGAALPRGAASDRTSVFGLSPTAAVIIAAALLVVVILAIVAMTRSGETTTTHVDRDRF